MVLLMAFTASVQAQIDVTICNNAAYTIANAASPSNGEAYKPNLHYSFRYDCRHLQICSSGTCQGLRHVGKQ